MKAQQAYPDPVSAPIPPGYPPTDQAEIDSRSSESVSLGQFNK